MMKFQHGAMKRWLLESWLCFFPYLGGGPNGFQFKTSLSCRMIICDFSPSLTTFKMIIASVQILSYGKNKLLFYIFNRWHILFWVLLSIRNYSPSLTYGKRPIKCFFEKYISLSDLNRKDSGCHCVGVIWQITLEEIIKSDIISSPPLISYPFLPLLGLLLLLCGEMSFMGA